MQSPAVAAVVLAALLLPGCSSDRAAEPPAAAAAAAPAGPVAAGRFDPQLSAALLAQAQEAQAAGNPAEAERLYRAAGLAWPDNEAAWQGLVTLARQRGAREEAAAAAFMLDRIRTYPSDQLYVQREINIALKQYISDQQALPQANPQQLAFATNLSEYYDALYATRGTYQPPPGLFGTGYGNIENRELPAAIVSSGAAIGYLGFLAGSSGNSSSK